MCLDTTIKNDADKVIEPIMITKKQELVFRRSCYLLEHSGNNGYANIDDWSPKDVENVLYFINLRLSQSEAKGLRCVLIAKNNEVN